MNGHDPRKVPLLRHPSIKIDYIKVVTKLTYIYYIDLN